MHKGVCLEVVLYDTGGDFYEETVGWFWYWLDIGGCGYGSDIGKRSKIVNKSRVFYREHKNICWDFSIDESKRSQRVREWYHFRQYCKIDYRVYLYLRWHYNYKTTCIVPELVNRSIDRRIDTSYVGFIDKSCPIIEQNSIVSTIT